MCSLKIAIEGEGEGGCANRDKGEGKDKGGGDEGELGLACGVLRLPWRDVFGQKIKWDFDILENNPKIYFY